jgi:hypothetical protein
MGVPNSEVGYTTAMPRMEDHEVHKDMWWHWIKKEKLPLSHRCTVLLCEGKFVYNRVLGKFLASRLDKTIFRKKQGFFKNMYLFKRLRSPHNMAEV